MKTKTAFKIILFCLLFSHSIIAQQKWPKVMSFINGRIVDPRWVENETRYYDWKGEWVKDFSTPTGTYVIQYVFVDSTGKTINNEKFDKAGGFFKGLAVVQTPNDYDHEKPRQFAVLNEKGEFVFPYSQKYIENMGSGFLKIISGDSTRVFNGQKKEIASCNKCDFSMSSTGRVIYQMPHPYSQDPQITKLYDLKGKLLIQKPGFSISYVSNNIAVNNEPQSYEMPFHVIKLDDSGMLFSVVSDQGKLMLDSIDNFVFNYGISCISRKGKKGFVVDSMFRVIVPSSYKNDRYWPLFTHPKKAFVAWRHDSVMVIDKLNKYLIKPMDANFIDYNDVKKQYEIRNTNKDYKWIITLNGDTIASPSRYFEYNDMRPLLPGAMVRCKPNRQMGYVSDKGEILIPCKYQQLAYGGPGRFIFFTETEAGYLDQNGKELFRIDSAISISNFAEGYAVFGFKKSDYRYGSQRVIGAEYSYSAVYVMIDSTGKIISDRDYDDISRMHNGYSRVRVGESVYLVNSRFEKVTTKEGHLLLSYFCNGTALAYDPKKNKIGLVNEKIETIVPVIYDWIDTTEEENAHYGFSLVNRGGPDGYSNYGNTCAKITDGKVRVRLGQKEMSVDVKK